MPKKKGREGWEDGAEQEGKVEEADRIRGAHEVQECSQGINTICRALDTSWYSVFNFSDAKFSLSHSHLYPRLPVSVQSELGSLSSLFPGRKCSEVPHRTLGMEQFLRPCACLPSASFS